MNEFLELTTPSIALEKFLDSINASVKREFIPTLNALGRILAEDILAPIPLPEFVRSTVDGYAVIAEDTFGASNSLPAYLEVIGEIPMGQLSDNGIHHTTCMKIHTGGMLPTDANAVVMLEQTQSVGVNELEIFKSVAPGENTINVGEDVSRGELVIQQGSTIRSAEIGGLMALGIMELPVARKPIVGIISTGDELIPPHKKTLPGQIRDINSYSLSSIVFEVGAIPKIYGIVADNFEQLKGVIKIAHKECDLVIITAGSSASSRDYTSRVINDIGSPGVLIHGINIKPGKPTILGNCEGIPVIGLPGNPVSAIVIAHLFVVPALNKLLGVKNFFMASFIMAKLTTNINSIAGREDWIPVRLIKSDTETESFVAEPIFGRSNFIFNLVKANGLIRIPSDVTGLSAEERIWVYKFA